MDDFVLGPYVVKPSLGHIERAGAVVRVRPRVMDLLVFFSQHPGIVLSPQRLLDSVWGTRFVTYSALTRTIAELRQAVGDDTKQPWLLETIPKRGYRLLVKPAAPAGVTAEAPLHDEGGDEGSAAALLGVGWRSVGGAPARHSPARA